MIIIVDERPQVSEAFRTSFTREGVSAQSFSPGDFDGWFRSTSSHDLSAVEAIVLGDFMEREGLTKSIKSRTSVPAIALNDTVTGERQPRKSRPT